VNQPKSTLESGIQDQTRQSGQNQSTQNQEQQLSDDMEGKKAALCNLLEEVKSWKKEGIRKKAGVAEPEEEVEVEVEGPSEEEDELSALLKKLMEK